MAMRKSTVFQPSMSVLQNHCGLQLFKPLAISMKNPDGTNLKQSPVLQPTNGLESPGGVDSDCLISAGNFLYTVYSIFSNKEIHQENNNNNNNNNNSTNSIKIRSRLLFLWLQPIFVPAQKNCGHFLGWTFWISGIVSTRGTPKNWARRQTEN